jgi:orotidine-5'-phosphate decarboxylase
MRDRIIVALDFPQADSAVAMAEKLRGEIGAVKVGFELFVSAGPDLVRRLVGMGHRVFLDLKLHDIPNTVAAAARSAARLGVWMLNVHALGGTAMMRAASEAASEEAARLGASAPKIIAVTVLTSMDDADVAQVGLSRGAKETALALARLAKDAGLDGVVCSPWEAASVRDMSGESFIRVTPGVRPAGSAKGDQKRIMTPSEAIKNGASFIVVGRPITGAPDPAAAARNLFD